MLAYASTPSLAFQSTPTLPLTLLVSFSNVGTNPNPCTASPCWKLARGAVGGILGGGSGYNAGLPTVCVHQVVASMLGSVPVAAMVAPGLASPPSSA